VDRLFHQTSAMRARLHRHDLKSWPPLAQRQWGVRPLVRAALRQHFRPLAKQAPHVLEIGIGGEVSRIPAALSLKMLAGFFRIARSMVPIFAIVVCPGDRIRSTGSQAEPDFLNKLISDIARRTSSSTRQPLE